MKMLVVLGSHETGRIQAATKGLVEAPARVSTRPGHTLEPGHSEEGGRSLAPGFFLAS